MKPRLILNPIHSDHNFTRSLFWVFLNPDRKAMLCKVLLHLQYYKPILVLIRLEMDWRQH